MMPSGESGSRPGLGYPPAWGGPPVRRSRSHAVWIVVAAVWLGLSACAWVLVLRPVANARRAALSERCRLAAQGNSDPDRALPYANKAISLNPRNAIAYNDRGNIYLKKGQLDAAMADYNKAIDLNPNYRTAHYNRALAYYSMGDKQIALADLTTAINLGDFPARATALATRGGLYVELGQLDAAVADCNRALSIDPKCSLAYANRGCVYCRKRDFKRAIPDLERGTSHMCLANAYWNLGAAYEAVGNVEDAVTAYLEFLDAVPRPTDPEQIKHAQAMVDYYTEPSKIIHTR
jgi:tetratricopeptide (TPR) repeat protein